MTWIVYLIILIELTERSLAGVDNGFVIGQRNLLFELFSRVRLLLVQLD